jgi:mono/diheme cytochrome c family protein
MAVRLTHLTAGQSPSPSISGTRPLKRFADDRGCYPSKSVQSEQHPHAGLPITPRTRTMTKLTIATALLSSIGFLTSAQTVSGVTASSAQSVDPSVGRHLAETVCSACHQISATSPNPSPNPAAPSFVDISRMPSTSELAIKVFLRTSHPTMPNFILSSEEIDSVTAYILSLARK